MPDIKSLPSLITDVNKLKMQQKFNALNLQIKEISEVNVSNENIDDVIEEEKNDDDDRRIQPRNVHFPDDITEDDKVFLAKFEQDKLDRAMWNHITLIRLIWCYLTFYKRENGTKMICENLAEYQGDEYHETLTYFWIHIVEYFKILLQQNDKTASFIEFWSILAMKDWKIANSYKYNLSDPLLWKEFYTEGVMYHREYQGIDAAKQLCIPDKKNLPSAVCYYVQG